MSEYVAGFNQSLDCAVNTALESINSTPSNETLVEARDKASKIIQGVSSSEDSAGLKDIQNFTLSMGLSAARAIFNHMINNVVLAEDKKIEYRLEIDKFSPLTEIGCMKVDYYNNTKLTIDRAFLVLGECSKLHDMGEQLDKIKPHISADKWTSVTRSISTLFFIGRSVYSQLARKNIDLIRRIHQFNDDDPCLDYLDLKIDRKNTTMFINDTWQSRIGIFVHPANENEKK